MFRRLPSVCAAALLAVAIAAPAHAQDFSAARLSEGVRVIADDSFEGRYPGTPGERLTLEWLQAQYESLGLEPGGPDGQWLQPVDLRRYTPVREFTATWAGPGGVGGTLVKGEGLNLRSAANDGRAEIAGAELVFAGYGIVAPERGWDDYKDVDVRGKIVVLLPGEPEGALFNGEYPTVYNAGWWKARDAAARGAIGVITLQPRLAPARFADAQRTFQPGGADLEVTGDMTRDSAGDLFAAAGLDLEALTAAAAAGGDFRATPLSGVTLTASAEETVNVLRTYNLLARIPGTQRPDETIIFSAHWDHVGIDNHGRQTVPEGEDRIWNGAWDNASGTVALVEMARELKAAGPAQRSFVFAHMAAEEMGLLGAWAYAADPVYPVETTVADLNIDMLPLSPPTRDLQIFGFGQNELEDDLARLAEAEGRYVTDDGQPEQGFYYRSDHLPFAVAGVPALMPWHGTDWDEGGKAVGEPAYRAMWEERYHKAADEWSEDLDFSAAVENLTLIYRLAVDLANSERWPGWKPTSEFGAIRARSAAARQ
ncbi:MAG TPA: M28 family peptidase [Brevundimonas sp.]|jgi:Zn-dependent M28 family amino/carboxypeptidase|uniref:M28 family peptidase n=1 Tax=Brevundimonas sp. TaxID=1871086 RepID=UPI002E0EB324|nr:M28 family peptidase [Brevundimonas sp.]